LFAFLESFEIQNQNGKRKIKCLERAIIIGVEKMTVVVDLKRTTIVDWATIDGGGG
jgi:hypothetical protein